MSTSKDREDSNVQEIQFADTTNLPWRSQIYQRLKSNPTTAWIAVLIKSKAFKKFLILLALISYFGVGIAYYGQKEGWGAGTTIFYTIVTMTTVGYGYHHPSDDESRIFTIFYIFFGVYFVFLVVADSVIQAMTAAIESFKRHFGKIDIATEYKYLNRLIYANVAAIIVTLLIGTAGFMALEGWSFAEALYFAVETSTTVGYGDIDIQHHDTTYPFCSVYIVFSTILLGFAISNLNEARVKRNQILKVSEMLLRNQGGHFLEELDSEGNGISESDFVLGVLLRLGVVDEDQDLAPWRAKFREISQNSHHLSSQQIKELKGTDTFDTSNQIRNLMIRSGLSIDIIETASVSSTGNPFPRLFSQELRPSMSFDTGIVRSKARDDAKAVLMRNSDP